MENNGEIENRTNLTRKPFSDLSNAASSSIPLPNTKRKRKLKSTSKQLEPDSHQIEARAQSETANAGLSREIATCSTAGPSDLDSVSGDCNFLHVSEPTTVYKRRSTNTREHTADATSSTSLSCPPNRRKIKKTNRENKSRKGKDNSVTGRVYSSAPCKRRKKPENFTLPEDFVREQRDYFAKLDEEKLIVEEANSG
ncbi:hypothetical protein FCM35_KLT07514 [Carex littledalei]|uniref:Uncharacterized protein n=1 Tax=Carex littledalei TaxID=544730 RepID=A0A833QZS4_9POAL|nr:hypothetical protein FCM35_KLT07514 [Carex littledalei]